MSSSLVMSQTRRDFGLQTDQCPPPPSSHIFILVASKRRPTTTPLTAAGSLENSPRAAVTVSGLSRYTRSIIRPRTSESASRSPISAFCRAKRTRPSLFQRRNSLLARKRVRETTSGRTSPLHRDFAEGERTVIYLPRGVRSGHRLQSQPLLIKGTTKPIQKPAATRLFFASTQVQWKPRPSIPLWRPEREKPRTADSVRPPPRKARRRSVFTRGRTIIPENSGGVRRSRLFNEGNAQLEASAVYCFPAGLYDMRLQITLF